MKLELAHFIDCIIHNKKPIISGDEAHKALVVAEEIIKNMEVTNNKKGIFFMGRNKNILKN